MKMKIALSGVLAASVLAGCASDRYIVPTPELDRLARQPGAKMGTVAARREDGGEWVRLHASALRPETKLLTSNPYWVSMEAARMSRLTIAGILAAGVGAPVLVGGVVFYGQACSGIECLSNEIPGIFFMVIGGAAVAAGGGLMIAGIFARPMEAPDDQRALEPTLVIGPGTAALRVPLW